MISITQEAAEKVKFLLDAHTEYEDPGLRVRVTGGGCSGHQYRLEVEDGCGDGDEVIEAFGARLFVDPESRSYLDSMVIDYEQGVMSSGFKFHNPRATHTCKCGESFSV